MIHSIFCLPDQPPLTDLSLEQIAQALAGKDGLLWVSLERASEQEFAAVLGDTFHFHPLVIEDCQSVGYQAPKVDIFSEYLFLVLHALKPGEGLEQLDLLEFNCFLGANYVVTSHTADEMPPVERVWRRLQRDERPLRQGADFLCHALLDELVDGYMPLIDALDDELDRLEDEVLAQPRTSTLDRILTLKHGILTVRRVIVPQREVLNRLSRDDLPQIVPRHRIYFRDIYDHLVRVHDLSESIRDVVSGTLDTYLSVTSNRLNEVMKALTIVSTIFLPLSFIAGVYGMNFVHMPELRQPWTYPLVWVIFALIAVGMLWMFKKRGWM
ncbi:MAG: magnesium/cobalt transporter CorA [Anaerolineae bacterium]|nr:magnesium/cobalt transporter CorA [Anaerolineae bacterium]